jgi:RNA polymerase sigma-70 factor (ECF subfamily)
MQERFTQFVEERQSTLYRAALRILGDPHDSEDAVQDGVLSAWRSLGSLRDPDKLQPWLVSIVCNAARRLGARRRRWVPEDEAVLIDEAIAETLGEDPRADRQAQVQRALTSLDDESFDMVLGYYAEEKTTAELAEAHGMQEASVRRRLTRVRRDLIDPLVRSSIEALGSTYREQVAPRLKGRLDVRRLRVLCRTDLMVAAMTPDGRGVLLSTEFEDREEVVPPGSTDLVIDVTNLHSPEVLLVGADQTARVPWRVGLGWALRAEAPMGITRQYLDVFGCPAGDEITLVRKARAITDVRRRHLTARPEISRALGGRLDRGTPETRLDAARQLLAAGLPRPVVAGLDPQRYSGHQLEARRHAALGYAHKLVGKPGLAVVHLEKAIQHQSGAWEWHLQLAEARALAGQHAEAAVALVTAFRLDDTGTANYAAHWNPHLKPHLAVPRLWRLLQERPRAVLPTATFLPLMPVTCFEF